MIFENLGEGLAHIFSEQLTGLIDFKFGPGY